MDKQRVKANIKSERGELSDSDEEDKDEDNKQPGMVEAGKDKEGNAMFDLNSKKKVFIKSYKG